MWSVPLTGLLRKALKTSLSVPVYLKSFRLKFVHVRNTVTVTEVCLSQS